MILKPLSYVVYVHDGINRQQFHVHIELQPNLCTTRAYSEPSMTMISMKLATEDVSKHSKATFL